MGESAGARCERLLRAREEVRTARSALGQLRHAGLVPLGLLCELRDYRQLAARLEAAGRRVSSKVKRSAYNVLRETGFGAKPDPVVMDVVSLGWSGFTTIECYAYNEYTRRPYRIRRPDALPAFL